MTHPTNGQPVTTDLLTSSCSACEAGILPGYVVCRRCWLRIPAGIRVGLADRLRERESAPAVYNAAVAATIAEATRLHRAEARHRLTLARRAERLST